MHTNTYANELLWIFTLSDIRKINLSLWIELERSSEARRSERLGRAVEGGEKINKKIKI